MASRSFAITIDNLTGQAWHLIGVGLDHGIWSNNGGFYPAADIPKVSLNDNGDVIPGVISFGNESNGFATGAEGFVDYQNSLGGVLHIHWDNPYIGSNSLDVNTPDGFHTVYGGYGGDNVNLNIDILRGNL